jgi:hypothetical protein
MGPFFSASARVISAETSRSSMLVPVDRGVVSSALILRPDVFFRRGSGLGQATSRISELAIPAHAQQ